MPLIKPTISLVKVTLPKTAVMSVSADSRNKAAANIMGPDTSMPIIMAVAIVGTLSGSNSSANMSGELLAGSMPYKKEKFCNVIRILSPRYGLINSPASRYVTNAHRTPFIMTNIMGHNETSNSLKLVPVSTRASTPNGLVMSFTKSLRGEGRSYPEPLLTNVNPRSPWYNNPTIVIKITGFLRTSLPVCNSFAQQLGSPASLLPLLATLVCQLLPIEATTMRPGTNRPEPTTALAVMYMPMSTVCP
mmetsp:Transcript_43483/g.131534  ORF Transcript_43483/g.131534 Transcript_43483/m.131534 type:complete len:247 (-) Transcript_43483:384-1124(-)